MKGITIKLIGLAFFLALAAAGWAADCTPGVGAGCSCGDRVNANGTLSVGVDPILGAICGADGLIVSNGKDAESGCKGASGIGNRDRCGHRGRCQ